MFDATKQWWKLVWAKSGDLIQVFQGKVKKQPPAVKSGEFNRSE